jgi:hypothetical protein
VLGQEVVNRGRLFTWKERNRRAHDREARADSAGNLGAGPDLAFWVLTNFACWLFGCKISLLPVFSSIIEDSLTISYTVCNIPRTQNQMADSLARRALHSLISFQPSSPVSRTNPYHI